MFVSLVASDEFQVHEVRRRTDGDNPDGVIYRPQVFIRIAGSRSELYLLALLDTGADETIMPISVAAEIGVELDATAISQASGVTGQEIELVPGHVELSILSEANTY